MPIIAPVTTSVIKCISPVILDSAVMEAKEYPKAFNHKGALGLSLAKKLAPANAAEECPEGKDRRSWPLAFGIFP